MFAKIINLKEVALRIAAVFVIYVKTSRLELSLAFKPPPKKKKLVADLRARDTKYFRNGINNLKVV